MSRDDSILATGTTSAILTSPKQQQVLEKQEAARQKRLDATHKLKPAAEPILNAIDAEYEAVTKRLLSMVAPGTPAEDVKSLLISLNLYKDSLSTLKSKLKVVLKESV